jgi:hypothetical protein
MKNITNKNTVGAGSSTVNQQQSQTSNLANPLPVLDICNNLITITSYLSAINSAVLPNFVVSDNPTLATEYADWQNTIWDQYFIGLLNSNILAEAQEMNNMINDGITEQSVFQSIINQSQGPVPEVIDSCDDMMNQISAGKSYLTQLQAIATSIQDADTEKIAQLNSIIEQLNNQFNDLEDKLTDKALDSGKEIVITTIEVGVAVGTEEDPIAPLIKGIAQVGFDIISELELSSEINATLAQLESSWTNLDKVTLQLAQVNLLLNQLTAVVTQTSIAIASLNNIVIDWQTICDTITTDTPAQWSKRGISKITEWSARMSRIQFHGVVSQTVNT